MINNIVNKDDQFYLDNINRYSDNESEIDSDIDGDSIDNDICIDINDNSKRFIPVTPSGSYISHNSLDDSMRHSNNSLSDLPIMEDIKLIRNKFYIRDIFIRELLSEFIGSFIYMLISNNIYANVIINGTYNITFIDWILISISCGISLVFGMYITIIKGGGGFLNPIIAFSVYLLKGMSGIKCFLYHIIYFVASFLSSFLIYIININRIREFGYGKDTSNIFTSYKNDGISSFNSVVVEFVLVILFIFIFLTLYDDFLIKKNIMLYCKLVCLLFIILSLSFGFDVQMAINPAMDFSSRIFLSIAPWGSSVFKYGNYWFWIPLIIPYIASSIGCVLYFILIKSQ